MTKKDYVLIAEIIRNLPIPPSTKRTVAAQFCLGLRANYKGSYSFDTERFMSACDPKATK